MRDVLLIIDNATFTEQSVIDTMQSLKTFLETLKTQLESQITILSISCSTTTIMQTSSLQSSTTQMNMTSTGAATTTQGVIMTSITPTLSTSSSEISPSSPTSQSSRSSTSNYPSSSSILSTTMTTSKTTTTPTKIGSSTTAEPPTTTTPSSPVDRIDAANAKIQEAIDKATTANRNKNAASEASRAVNIINSALETVTTTTASSGRVKRQSGSSTVSPIGSCEDFTARYKQLLDELEIITDDNIDLIQQLVTVLTNSVQSVDGIPCSNQDKASLKSETQARLATLKDKSDDYIDDQNTKIVEAGAEVSAALVMIEAANEELIEQNKPTMTAVEPNFTFPTEIPTTAGPNDPETTPEPQSTEPPLNVPSSRSGRCHNNAMLHDILQ